MNNKEALLEKIATGQAKIGIVGMGYVGLPLAVAFAKAGYHILGVDVAADKVAALNAGQSYVEDVADAVLAPLVEDGRLQASTD